MTYISNVTKSKLFDALLTSTSSVTLLLDGYGNVLQANQAAADLFQTQAHALANQPLKALCRQNTIPFPHELRFIGNNITATDTEGNFTYQWHLSYVDEIENLYLLCLNIKKSQQNHFSEQQTALIDHIIASFPDYVYVTDINKNIITCNDNLAELVGLHNRNEAKGLSWEELPTYLHHKEGSAEIKNNIINTYHYKTDNTSREKLYNPVTKTEHYYLVRRRCLHSENGTFNGVITAMCDITELETRAEASEQNLKDIINLIPGNVFWIDKTGKLLGCNKQQAKMFGTSPHAIIGKSIYDLLPNQRANELAKNNQLVMEKRKKIEFTESSMTRENPNGRSYLVSKAPLYRDNSVFGVIGVAIETTEREQLLHEVEQANERYQKLYNEQSIIASAFRDVIDLSPVNIYWYDKNNRFAGCNKQQAKLIGLNDVNDIVGRSPYDFINKKDADRLIAANNKVMRERKTQVFEEPHPLGNGKLGVFKTYKAPMIDAEGNIFGVLGLSFDLTEQKQHEQDLDEAKERAEAALENFINLIPANIYWFDKNDVLLGMNETQAKTFHLDRKKVIGKPAKSFLKKSDYDLIAATNKEVLEKDEVVSKEELTTRPGKDMIYFSQKAPLKNSSGETIGVLGISFDITDRKEAEQALNEAKEQAEEANMAKAEFIANMSHDLRTPLHAILGMAETLEKQRHYHGQEELIDNIQSAGNTLLTLVEDILQFSRIEARQLTVSKRSFDIKELIEDVSVTISSQARKKGLELIVDIDDKIPNHVISDPDFLRRILLNLVSNAIKFTESGHIRIALQTKATLDKKDFDVCITVEDTGIGMPKDVLGGIFDRFYRVDPTYRGNHKGLGLGLSIVKQMIEEIGGTVEVDSELGKGSSFAVTIPVSIDEEAETIAAEAKNENKFSLKVLLVEDDNMARMVSSTILAELGCTVDTAVNAAEAIEKSLAEPWDVIFMDIGLPDKTGLEATRDIRNENNGQKLTIYALTAHASEDDEKMCFDAGMNGFLVKPAGFDAFKKVLTKITHSKKSAN